MFVSQIGIVPLSGTTSTQHMVEDVEAMAALHSSDANSQHDELRRDEVQAILALLR